jgi:hypothetical protein
MEYHLMVQHADIDHTGLTGVGGGSSAAIANEFKNWPTLEGVDNGQPEWWEVNANCTLTDVDVAGESITETWERCLKIVTSADSYCYQPFTYADEPRIKSGRTVSVSVAVWSVGSVTARVRLQSSVGSLDVASTTAAAWTILTLEATVLDGTSVQVRFEAATGTAYFVPLAFGVGDTAPHELPPRGHRFRWRDPTSIKVLTGLGDEDTWTDIDCTSATSNLCCMILSKVTLFDNDGTDEYVFHTRRNGSSQAKGDATERARVQATNQRQPESEMTQIVDDGQIFEYDFDRVNGTGTLDYGEVFLLGWWEWA